MKTKQQTLARLEEGQRVGSWQPAAKTTLLTQGHPNEVGEEQKGTRSPWQEDLTSLPRKRTLLFQSNLSHALAVALSHTRAIWLSEAHISLNSVLGETTKRPPSTVSYTTTIPHVHIASFHHFRGSVSSQPSPMSCVQIPGRIVSLDPPYTLQNEAVILRDTFNSFSQEHQER